MLCRYTRKGLHSPWGNVTSPRLLNPPLQCTPGTRMRNGKPLGSHWSTRRPKEARHQGSGAKTPDLGTHGSPATRPKSENLFPVCVPASASLSTALPGSSRHAGPWLLCGSAQVLPSSTIFLFVELLQNAASWFYLEGPQTLAVEFCPPDMPRVTGDGSNWNSLVLYCSVH